MYKYIPKLFEQICSLPNSTMAIPKFLFLFLCYVFTSYADSGADTYIIHMDISSMPKAFSSHHTWFLSTLSSITDPTTNQFLSSSSSKLVYTYTNAIHGFSAVLSPAELDSLKKSPGYVSSVKDMLVKIDTTHSFQFLGLNPNYGAWPGSDYGRDVIIGMVDTGVWPESISFNENGMGEVPFRWKGECQSGVKFNSSNCNKKLIGARYFNRGLLAKNPNLTISMNSARDTDGHGTHTSSTAAGNYADGASFFGYATGRATSMAPKAHVAMYKAIWDEGGHVSDIIAAIDAAIMDGVDVLSLSFGLDDVPLYNDPVAIATFAAVEKGIFVSTSSGNEGPESGTLHNGTPWVLTVAAGTVDREFQGTLDLGNGVSVTGVSLYSGNYSSARFSAIYILDCDKQDAFKAVRRKIVVCLDRNNTVSQQVEYAKDAKLAGAVFITDQSDLSSDIQTSFPCLFLTVEEGQSVLEYAKNNAMAKGRFKFQQTRIGTKPAPQLTSYSSRGPSRSCPVVLKPDLMAPGDLILASWPPNISVTEVASRDLYNNFNLLSGTSMSCPHATGVAALIKGVHPGWSPAAIRSAMMTTAHARDNTGQPIKDIGFKNEPATPLGMGAGHIYPNNALKPGLVYDASPQDYINLLCALKFNSTQIKAIVRSSSYTCLNPSLDLNYPSFTAYFNANDTNSHNTIVEKKFKRTVTNVGEPSSVYTAKLVGLKGLKVSISPNRLDFTKMRNKRSFTLRIRGPARIKDLVVHGSLTWTDYHSKFSVRSPIVAMSLDP